MDENGVKLVCFEICGERFAFNMEYLVEIAQVQPTEIVPFFPSIPIIRGKWEYRGTTAFIFDIRDFFGLEEQQRLQEAEDTVHAEHITTNMVKNVLVVKIHDRIFGLLTDTVSQMQPLEVLYEYPVMVSKLPRRYFAGVTKSKAGLVILFAIEKFINAEELETLLSQRDEYENDTHLFAD